MSETQTISILSSPAGFLEKLHQWCQLKHTHRNTIFFLTKLTLSQALRNMNHVHHEISWNNVLEKGSLREHERAFSSLQARCKETSGFYHAELPQDPVKLLKFVTFTIQQQSIGLNRLSALHNNFLATHTPDLTKHTCWTLYEKETVLPYAACSVLGSISVWLSCAALQDLLRKPE